MRDYQRKGCSQYGADMGRDSDLPFDVEGPLTIRHVPLDEGGYDPGGAYWGAPNDLYLVEEVGEDSEGRVCYLRAGSDDKVRVKFPRAAWADPEAELPEADLEDMLGGYVECALWSSSGPEEGPEFLSEKFSREDVAEETLVKMRADCEKFARDNLQIIAKCLSHGRCDWSRAGHDFWLTRNGHGAGFWDGDWPEAEGEALTQASRKFGEVWLYVGDDGKVRGA